jgi:hypothetical protein
MQRTWAGTRRADGAATMVVAHGGAARVLHRGPPAPGQLPDLTAVDRSSACSEPLMPYVTPLSLLVHETQLVALVAERATVGMIPSEPPLRCDVTATCGSPGPA